MKAATFAIVFPAETVTEMKLSWHIIRSLGPSHECRSARNHLPVWLCSRFKEARSDAQHVTETLGGARVCRSDVVRADCGAPGRRGSNRSPNAVDRPADASGPTARCTPPIRRRHTIYALDLGAQATGGAPGTANVAGIDEKIAAMLGTDAKDIAITDLVVHPTTHNAFLSVMRGQGAAAKPALVRVDGAGKIDAGQHRRAVVHERHAAERARPARQRDPVDHAGEVRQRPRVGQRTVERRVRVEAVVDCLSVRARPTAGTSLEIFHDNHQQLETRAPMYAFVPYTHQRPAVHRRRLHLHAARAVPGVGAQAELRQQVSRRRRSPSSAPATGRST